jgi:hypothetical protein
MLMPVESCAVHWQVSEGLDVLAAIDEAFVDDSGRPLQVPVVGVIL